LSETTCDLSTNCLQLISISFSNSLWKQLIVKYENNLTSIFFFYYRNKHIYDKHVGYKLWSSTDIPWIRRVSVSNTTPTHIITLNYVIFLKLLTVSACQCLCRFLCPFQCFMKVGYKHGHPTQHWHRHTKKWWFCCLSVGTRNLIRTPNTSSIGNVDAIETISVLLSCLSKYKISWIGFSSWFQLK
jgi:hypothetical protein